MSSVRMCDKCGKVFSENEENWSTGSGTQFYTDDKGLRKQREKQEDRCGGCNGTPQVVSPMIEGKSRTEELEMQELRDRLALLEGRPEDMGKPTIQGTVE